MDKETLETHYHNLKEIEKEYYQKKHEISGIKSQRDKQFAKRGLIYIRKRCSMYIRNNQELHELFYSDDNTSAGKTFKMDEFSSGDFFENDLALLLEDIKKYIKENE